MWVTNAIPIFNLKLLDVIDSVHVALQYAFYLAIEKSIKNAAHQHDLSLSTVATVVVDIIRMGTHNVPYIYNACTPSRIIDLNLLCSTAHAALTSTHTYVKVIQRIFATAAVAPSQKLIKLI